MVKYLKDKYPGRLTETFGDSTVTLPKTKLDTKCDIAIIDGGHFGKVPLMDILNMKCLSHEDTLMIVDDTVPAVSYGVDVVKAVQYLEEVGVIQNVFICSNAQQTRGYAAYKYTQVMSTRSIYLT